MQVVVVGGGAAGFFAAISVKDHFPDSEVTILEKSSKLLAKVKISGGGRCNVTHDCQDIDQLLKHYPRGREFLGDAFKRFAVKQTIEWFRQQGVKLKTEQDGRMFPVSNRSDTIIDALINAANKSGVQIKLQCAVISLKRTGRNWSLSTSEGVMNADKIIVATGGSPKSDGFEWLSVLGQSIVEPVPSLFTFKIHSPELTSLQGLSMPSVHVRIKNSEHTSIGPLLITHWGISGPAVLKLSAEASRLLAEWNYDFNIQIDWLHEQSEKELRRLYEAAGLFESAKQMVNQNIFGFPQRLWAYFLMKAKVDLAKPGAELGKKGLYRLLQVLKNDEYHVKGKTTFKEEFVTAGGVDLAGVDRVTMKSKTIDDLYYAGEVMDIDGVTGGFNFQAAWTTGRIAGKLT